APVLGAGTTQWSAARSKEAAPPQSVSVAVNGRGVPLELHWFRNSAERRALYREIYLGATQSVRVLSSGLAPDSWAVILDVDETVLDNSPYQPPLPLTGQRSPPHTRAPPAPS